MSRDLEPSAECDPPWFAVMVKPHHEKAVANALLGKGYSAFLPLYESRRFAGGRLKTAWLPLFPTYLFSRFDPRNRLPILTTPGVFSVVGSANRPLPVEESEITAIQRILECGQKIDPWPYVQAGDPVEVARGPLKGLQGLLLSVGSPRLLVSVTLLQRTVAVELERDWIRPARYISFSSRDSYSGQNKGFPCLPPAGRDRA